MKKSVFTLVALLLLATMTSIVVHAQTYIDLVNFDGSDGELPQYPNLLAQGRDGDLYGTTTVGGANGYGIVFKATLSGSLSEYSFDGRDGSYPTSGLTLGTDGNFYGATTHGSSGGYGTTFKITPTGSLTTLYRFTNGLDGAFPAAPPLQGTDGSFYGTTLGTEIGTAYKLTSSGGFTAFGLLPGRSTSTLIEATDGNFYGTTGDGGDSEEGTVFRMTPKGVVTVVHSFGGAGGGNPAAPMIQGSDGNLYGTTVVGGEFGVGIVFKLTPHGIMLLHNFGDPNFPQDGANPYAGLVQASDGNFYGVTSGGGTSGYGVIFQLSSVGNYSILYDFDGTSGANPQSTPMQHTNGKIYGLTANGGISNNGVLYSFDLGLGAFVRLVSTAGRVGQTGGILGQGFTGTTGVALNGIPASFTVVSDTFINATVPPDATTGYVTVVTPSGTLTSNVPFRVIP